MNMTLMRTDYLDVGIFGELQDADSKLLCYTLEHAYSSKEGEYASKIPDGTYACKRGQHRLAHMHTDFETFEVLDVVGHTNILFHVGNFNNDSEGCILLGMNAYKNNNPAMITESNKAFQKFMDLQKDVDEFTLTVKRKT